MPVPDRWTNMMAIARCFFLTNALRVKNWYRNCAAYRHDWLLSAFVFTDNRRCDCDLQCKNDGRETALRSVQLHCDRHWYESDSFLRRRLLATMMMTSAELLNFQDSRCTISVTSHLLNVQDFFHSFIINYVVGLFEDKILWHSSPLKPNSSVCYTLPYRSNLHF